MKKQSLPHLFFPPLTSIPSLFPTLATKERGILIPSPKKFIPK